jgi:3-deoxy-D-manno-octulosonic-acid transferase
LKLLFYDLFILCFEAGAWLLSPFNVKARQWLKGRVNWADKLQQQVSAIPGYGKTGTLWMHASSLGEFEQGKPLLDELQKKNPTLSIVITFFSPSGFEFVKNYEGAHIITYLPTDTPANALRFLDIIKPTLVIWVKYEYWYHHLKALDKRKIPVLLVSAAFWREQVFFKWYGSFHRNMLRFFDHYFVQTSYSAELLREILEKENLQDAAKNISVSGDTRFDRVFDIAENWQPVIPVENWLNGENKVLVAGSTWPEDEEELVHFFRQNRDIKLVLAPHEVEPDQLKDTMKLFGETTLFSDLLKEDGKLPPSNILIINNVGLLRRLYKYARVCYVGGGFSGNGIHNVLEAAVYGKPVLHGPDYERYQEAVGLVEAGGGFVADSAITLEKKLTELFSDDSACEKAASAAQNFVYQSKGSTLKIMQFIQENRLLTSL